MPDSDVAAVRRQFATAGRLIHFNHAGTAPLPAAAVAAMRQVLERIAAEGDLPYLEAEAVVEQARRRAALLAGAGEDEVGFVANTTAGLIVAVGSIDWQPGDNLVMMADAFPTNSYPYRLLLPGIELREFQSGQLAGGLDWLFSRVDRRTRAVALDWVHFLSGRRVDIGAVGRFCRERDIVLIVDGMQGLGVVDLDLGSTGADFVAAGANKWLLGPYGTGILFVRRERLARMKPSGLGWLSCRWDGFNDIFTTKELKAGADRFEAGTKNYPGLYGLNQALKFLCDFGRSRVAERIEVLTGRLRAGLLGVGFEVSTPVRPEEHAGVVSARRQDIDMARLYQRLTDAGVVCSLRENWLRLSPHFYNTEDEVDRFGRLLAAGSTG